MPDSRSLHANPSGACPWTVYLYMKENEIRIWPEEKIRIRPDEGVVWTAIDLGGPVGDFTIRFPQGSPFERREFDQRHRYSGPVRNASMKRFTYHIVHAGKPSPDCFVEIVEPKTEPGVVREIVTPDDGRRVAPKRIAVSDDSGTTAVDCPSMPVWSAIDEIEWTAENPNTPITVEFKQNASPFTWVKMTSTGVLRSGKVSHPGRKKYRYTITLDGLVPLDPDVEVDPPGGGGGDGG